MKIITTKKYAQLTTTPAKPKSLYNTLPSTAPVQDEGLGQNQVVAPGAVGQPAAHPADLQNGPMVEPSDPDAEISATEDELFPIQGGHGGNARPDVYPNPVKRTL